MKDASSCDGEAEVTEEVIVQKRNRPWKCVPQFSDEGCHMIHVEGGNEEEEGEDVEQGEGLLQYYRHNRLLEAENPAEMEEDVNGELEVIQMEGVLCGKPPEEPEEPEIQEERIDPVRIERKLEMERTGEWGSGYEPLVEGEEMEEHAWSSFRSPVEGGEAEPPPGVTFEEEVVAFQVDDGGGVFGGGVNGFQQPHDGDGILEKQITVPMAPCITFTGDEVEEAISNGVNVEMDKVKSYLEEAEGGIDVGLGYPVLSMDLEKQPLVEEEEIMETKVSCQSSGFPAFSYSEEIIQDGKSFPSGKVEDEGQVEDVFHAEKTWAEDAGFEIGVTPTVTSDLEGEPEEKRRGASVGRDSPEVKVKPGHHGGTLPPLGSKVAPDKPSKARRAKSESFFGFIRKKSKTREGEEKKKEKEEKIEPEVKAKEEVKVQAEVTESGSKSSLMRKLGFGRGSKTNKQAEKQTEKKTEAAGEEGTEEKAKGQTAKPSQTGKTNIRIFEILAKDQEDGSTAPPESGKEKEVSNPQLSVSQEVPLKVHVLTDERREDSVQAPYVSSTEGKGFGENVGLPSEEKHHLDAGGSGTMTSDYLGGDGGGGAELRPTMVAEAGGMMNSVDARRKYIVAVAIDFGTAFSGYAFCFLSDPDSIHMMGRWEDGDPGVINQKTPTTLLITPNGEFHSFGFTARNNYHDLSNEDAKEWMFFDRFKMTLYETQDFNEGLTIEAANGKRFPALEAISMTLRFFRDHALDQISSQSETRILNDDVLWIVTVPAIWKASAKQLMRLAAYKAELASAERPDQLLVALEPEAASVHIRRLQMRHLVPDKPIVRPLSIRLDQVDPAEMEFLSMQFTHVIKYVVVDCGGGTVDITVHEMNPVDHRLQELHIATGGPHGSFAIDHDFELLLGDIFGREFIEAYRRDRPSGWIGLMMAFETRKRAADPGRTNPLNIALPFSFIEYHRKTKGSPVDEAIKNYGDNGVRWSSQGMLRLTPDVMKKLFNPTLARIRDAIDNVFKSVKDIEYLFLVGGLSESGILQSDIREHFKDRVRKVIIPQEASLAVIKGAVQFGLDPLVISVRRSKLTYGAAVLNRFLRGKHPDTKLVHKEGVDWCRDVFDIFVSAGQVVRTGERVVRQYIPAAPSQKRIVIGIYSSDGRNPGFVSDPGVKKCANVSLDLTPESTSGSGSTSGPLTRRRIQAELIFAETEIRVTATDTTNGKQVNASIDFLNF